MVATRVAKNYAAANARFVTSEQRSRSDMPVFK
jgi:hypothetical protein